MIDGEGAGVSGACHCWHKITSISRAEPFTLRPKDICCQQVTPALSLPARPTDALLA